MPVIPGHRGAGQLCVAVNLPINALHQTMGGRRLSDQSGFFVPTDVVWTAQASYIAEAFCLRCPAGVFTRRAMSILHLRSAHGRQVQVADRGVIQFVLNKQNPSDCQRRRAG
jgi:hypothetical protein